MSNEISFSESPLPTVSAVGKISLTKPRLHMDQVAPCHFLIFVISGCFFVSEDNEHYSVREGQVFFRQAGRHHYSKTYMSPGTAWFWVSFSLDAAQTGESYELPKLFSIEDRTVFFHRLDTMLKLHQSKNPYKHPHLSAELAALFYTILAAPSHLQRGNGMIVKSVNELLASMVCQPFDAKKIARGLNLDYSYIGKCYKAATGMTINQHFNDLKVHKAIDYMQNGMLSITAISDSLGFANPFYFSRVFKKYTGVSPSDYIRHLY